MFESRKSNRDSRIDFERELSILGEDLIKGRLNIPKNFKSFKDLKRVRYSPNNRFNLDTITEMVRSMAMSINFNTKQFIPKDENE